MQVNYLIRDTLHAEYTNPANRQRCSVREMSILGAGLALGTSSLFLSSCKHLCVVCSNTGWVDSNVGWRFDGLSGIQLVHCSCSVFFYGCH